MTNAQTKVGSILIFIGILFLIFTTFSLLSHFEIFNLRNMLPSSCSFGSEVSCERYDLNKEGVSLELINNFNQAIVITEIVAAKKENEVPCNTTAVDQTWIPRESLDVQAYCDISTFELIPNFKEKLIVKIKYFPTKSGETFTKEISGTVFAMYHNETLMAS